MKSFLKYLLATIVGIIIVHVIRVYRTRRGHSQFLQSHDRDQGQHDTKTITEDSDPGQGIREPISEL